MSRPKQKWEVICIWLLAMIPAFFAAELLTPAWEGFWKGFRSGRYALEAYYSSYGVFRVIFLLTATLFLAPRPKTRSAACYGLLALILAIWEYGAKIARNEMYWEGICAISGCVVGAALAMTVGKVMDFKDKQNVPKNAPNSPSG